MSAARLIVSELYKSFATPVLTGVSLSVKAGQIHALVGENGAGKSTLINILSGLLPYDTGEFFLDGRSYYPSKANDALNNGISFAAQELSLSDNLSIAENIALRKMPHRRLIIKRNELLEKAYKLMKLVGLAQLDPVTPVGCISLGQRQLVELAKALAFDCRLLILDEPTATLTEPQAQRLHEIIRDLADKGTSIIYISHRLADVRSVADTISVLRDGQVVINAPADSLTVEEIIVHMSGRKTTAAADTKYNPRQRNKPVLKVNQLTTRDLPFPISFTCHEGELVGIAGLAGSGQPELLEAIFGLTRAYTGAVLCYLDDDWNVVKSPQHAVKLGIGFLPEDRKTEGIFSGHSIKLNITLPGLKRHSGKTGIIRQIEENQAATELIHELSVKCHGTKQNIELLSGGNQQKVLVGRWLHNASQIFLLNEPTRGVDVNTKYALHKLIREHAQQGTTIVIVSSEIEELMSLCDRILVFSDRKHVRTFARETWSYNAILEAAFSEFTQSNVQPLH